MATIGVSVGTALFLLGAVLVAPAGRVLAVVGLASAAVAGVRSRRRARTVAVGIPVGVVEAALAVGVTVWWSKGHHVSWPVVASVIGAVAVVLLGYVAVTVRRIAAHQ